MTVKVSGPLTAADIHPLSFPEVLSSILKTVAQHGDATYSVDYQMLEVVERFRIRKGTEILLEHVLSYEALVGALFTFEGEVYTLSRYTYSFQPYWEGELTLEQVAKKAEERGIDSGLVIAEAQGNPLPKIISLGPLTFGMLFREMVRKTPKIVFHWDAKEGVYLFSSPKEGYGDIFGTNQPIPKEEAEAFANWIGTTIVLNSGPGVVRWVRPRDRA